MEKKLSIPRLLIGGTASGVGKTTTVVGLTKAFQARRLKVATFKCGPDYLDPTYHQKTTLRPCHNLDGWMMGKEGVLSTFVRGCQGADLALIEGVMGLFDGASPSSEAGSSGEIAKWLSAPTLLVVDASGMARTLAAIVTGFKIFDPDFPLAGVISNYVGSRGHLELLVKATMNVAPVVGGWPKEEAFRIPSRHLGLLTASSNAISETLLSRWGELAKEWLDLEKILSLAKAAPSLSTATLTSPTRVLSTCRLGIAFDEAFHFYYEDNLRQLEALGAELIRFSPIHEKELPDVDGLYFGGGYPEVFASELSGNLKMHGQIRRFRGPIYAECGGLMYLSNAIHTLDGKQFPMVGLLPGVAVMRDKLQALGYVEVETQEPSILGAAGLRFRGHQFRYSNLERMGDAMPRFYSVRRRRGGETEREGFGGHNLLASYVHAHWASNPMIPQSFLEHCLRYQAEAKL